jgi:hypothetical protein
MEFASSIHTNHDEEIPYPRKRPLPPTPPPILLNSDIRTDTISLDKSLLTTFINFQKDIHNTLRNIERGLDELNCRILSIEYNISKLSE